MRRWLLSLSPTLLLAASACDPNDSGDPARARFATSLGVDLTTMSRSPSGLYTQDQQVGTGAEATPGRLVTVHYTGWLADGTQFDTSRDTQEPFSFTLGQGKVIQGWDEGVAGMRVGGQRRLVIPSALGYGERGVGPIPPNAVLVFDVELLTVR